MKLQQKVSLYIVALIVLPSLATSTFATCPTMQQGPPCQEFWRADAVFIGTATRVVRVPNETQLMIGPYVRSITHFSVEEAFKGVEESMVIFEADHCGQLFKEGERYLVYARYSEYPKKLEVRAGWSRTRLLSEAAEDLAYIRNLPSATTGSRIFGKVLQQGFKEAKMAVEPLRNVRVSLESEDDHREVATDDEGRFEFTSLPTATYRIRVEVPSYLEAREHTIKAPERGCLTFDLFALYNRQIAGRVLDTNGKPVRNVGITLVSADAEREHILALTERSSGVTNYSDRDGSYSFSQIMPGRYLLVVNRGDFGPSGSEMVRALPRIFYPGVTDIGAATVIVVTNDQKPQAYDIVLPIQQ